MPGGDSSQGEQHGLKEHHAPQLTRGGPQAHQGPQHPLPLLQGDGGGIQHQGEKGGQHKQPQHPHHQQHPPLAHVIPVHGGPEQGVAVVRQDLFPEGSIGSLIDAQVPVRPVEPGLGEFPRPGQGDQGDLLAQPLDILNTGVDAQGLHDPTDREALAVGQSDGVPDLPVLPVRGAGVHRHQHLPFGLRQPALQQGHRHQVQQRLIKAGDNGGVAANGQGAQFLVTAHQGKVLPGGVQFLLRQVGHDDLPPAGVRQLLLHQAVLDAEKQH